MLKSDILCIASRVDCEAVRLRLSAARDEEIEISPLENAISQVGEIASLPLLRSSKLARSAQSQSTGEAQGNVSLVARSRAATSIQHGSHADFLDASGARPHAHLAAQFARLPLLSAKSIADGFSKRLVR